jgi:uncharacterized protein DUF6457
MDEWLAKRAEVLGSSVSDDEARELLRLAKLAAHTSGERTNAPLLCYLVGVAVGRGGNVEELAEAVRSTS